MMTNILAEYGNAFKVFAHNIEKKTRKEYNKANYGRSTPK